MDRQVDFLGRRRLCLELERFGMADLFLAQNMGLRHCGALVPIVLVLGGGPQAVGTRDPLLHHRARSDRVLHVRLVHAGVPRDVRGDAGREAVPPSGRRDLRVRRADRRSWPAIWCIAGSTDAHTRARAQRFIAGLRVAALIVAFTLWLAATTVGTRAGLEADRRRALLRRRRRRGPAGCARRLERAGLGDARCSAPFTTADLALEQRAA